ncbi:hypothetical protein K461DRAFT_323186 [Myriangium duriaei CBS 260.36]|uniref:Uncharacterized protein n=1 Tax=Myriangium duriaei CBS 260.36 TaxID=1168546 RepID=A0A9P4MF91_9PEZI|nr:hypothetical protein K461DRAFT_323186 [Myriangium duriaei CBS 260.36]
MRYKNWDVLIFPGGSGVPIQEFRTASFAADEGSEVVPVLVTYLPSLAQGTPFTISIHSWVQPRFEIDLTRYRRKIDAIAAWAVRVMVDGICVSSLTFTKQAAWPQIIDSCDHLDVKGDVQPLPFPSFNRSVLSRRDWDLTGDQGRIKITITEGFRNTDNGKVKFQPVGNTTHFAFIPAPLAYLERCNIAWPNAVMFSKPWKSNPPQAPLPVMQSSHIGAWDDHAAYPFLPSSYPRFEDPSVMAAPLCPSHLPNPTVTSHPFPETTSWSSSRSTSMASHEEARQTSFWQNPEGFGLDYPLTRRFGDTSTRPTADYPVVRLPSDQLRQITSAISNKGSPSLERYESTKQSLGFCAPTASHSSPNFTVDVNAGRGHQSVQDKERVEHNTTNRYRTTSDVTMHSNCNGYPSCTSEDPVSDNVVHTTPKKDCFVPGEAAATWNASIDSLPISLPITISKSVSQPSIVAELEAKRKRRRPTPLVSQDLETVAKMSNTNQFLKQSLLQPPKSISEKENGGMMIL